MGIRNIEQQLLRDEDEVLHAYTDSLGYLTIGVGRLIDERRGGGISHDESMYLLRNDVNHVRHELLERWPWMAQLSEARFGVFLNMAFQLGVSGLAGFRNTLACAEHHDWQGTSSGMFYSLWARQTPKRCSRLRRQIETDEWQ